MTAEEFAEHVKVVELPPRSVIFIDYKLVPSVSDLQDALTGRLPSDCVIITTDGPPEVMLKERWQIEHALKCLDGLDELTPPK